MGLLFRLNSSSSLPVSRKLVNQTVLQTPLANVVSLRLREGYTIRSVRFEKGIRLDRKLKKKANKPKHQFDFLQTKSKFISFCRGITKFKFITLPDRFGLSREVFGPTFEFLKKLRFIFFANSINSQRILRRKITQLEII